MRVEKCKIPYRRERRGGDIRWKFATRRYFGRAVARARTLCTYASDRNGAPIVDPGDGLKLGQTVFGD